MMGLAEVSRCESAGTEVDQNGSEHRRRRGNIKQRLHLATEILFDDVDVLGEFVERCLFIVTARHVGRAIGDTTPHLGVELPA